MNSPFSKVAVIGLGYIGLPTAATLASRGIDVIGVDIDRRVIEPISKGEAHFAEPDLDMLVHSAVKRGKLAAALAPQEADAFIIAVPTPLRAGHEPDLVHVEAAARALAPVLEPGNLVILESTSPVGTTEKLAGWIREERPDLATPLDLPDDPDVFLAYCPERILPGRMVAELVENDRIIGGLTPACAEHAAGLYARFVRGECHVTEARAAEAVKLMENAYRDVNIAFANELSMICDSLGVDPWRAIELANLHPRVNILSPGPGVGGHCIAVDPWFLVHSAPDRASLIRTAREVNDAKPEFILEKVRREIQTLHAPTVACLGLSYKANVDDLRESPALRIVESLAEEEKVRLLVVEPNIDALPDNLLGRSNVALCDPDESLHRADVVLLLVDHDEFKEIDARALLGKIVIDSRGVWRDTVSSKVIEIDRRGEAAA